MTTADAQGPDEGRTVQPARLLALTTKAERDFHRQMLADIQPNVDSKDELVFPATWVRMWLLFDERLMRHIERLEAE